MSRGNVRIGDEERHKTAEILSDHYAHGRLSQEEFEDRLGAALTAKTTADLGGLLADLPLRQDVKRLERHSQLAGGELARKEAPVVLTLGGLAGIAAAADAAAPYSAHHNSVYVFGAGLFCLVAGRAASLLARRQQADVATADSGE